MISSTLRAAIGGAGMVLCLWSTAWGNGTADKFVILTSELDAWLTQNSPYPPAASAAEIRFISSGQLSDISGGAARHDSRTRGLYEPETATIYLVEPWSDNNLQDISVLLHELAHHRQTHAKHWYCEAAKEKPAYELQRDWLAEHGEELQVNWIEITLMEGCSMRDFHPG